MKIFSVSSGPYSDYDLNVFEAIYIQIKIFFLIQRKKMFWLNLMWFVYKYTHVNILLTRAYFLATFFSRCAQNFIFSIEFWQVKSDNRLTHFSFSFFLLPTCVIVVFFWYFLFVFITYCVYVSVCFCLRVCVFVCIGQILGSFSLIGLYYAINFPNQEIFSLSLDW